MLVAEAELRPPQRGGQGLSWWSQWQWNGVNQSKEGLQPVCCVPCLSRSQPGRVPDKPHRLADFPSSFGGLGERGMCSSGTHVAPGLGTLSVCWHCQGVTRCVFLGTPRFLCSGALPARLGPALGEVVVSLGRVAQSEMRDTLWESRTLLDLEKPTGKPKSIPAKQVVSQWLIFTN